MSTLTKLLPANAAPAQTLLDKAHALPLTSAQRAELPQVIHTPEGEVELGVPADQLRPVEVNDVFVDEKGGFWAVRPAVEKVLNVTGDVNVLREAAGALVNRGVRIAQIEEGFAVLPLPNLAKMLQMVGLEVTEAESPFDPIQFKAAHGGCGCHDDEDSCGCGHHHHHHDHDGECCCGGHGHEHKYGEGECCCGHGHHEHDHEEGECCCGGYISLKEKKMASNMVDQIMASASYKGAEELITACPLCMYNLRNNGTKEGLPVTYFTELLAEALGIKEEVQA